ncbi:MAG: hypothetical protein LC808_25970 [Actinobacteria bacterium]|nr:hypothetical protein [Actinomycetota bacterium]
MADVSGAQLKLGRALEHLLSLDDAIAAYLGSDPVNIVREIDQRHPERVVFSMALKEEPPATLSAVIGDCVHNLRASLDHLAWQLVLANGGVPREGPRGTHFPILTKLRQDGTKPAVIVAGGVSTKALTRIDAVQPFHRRDAEKHPLAILSRLDNIDKHRSLLLSTAQSVRTQAYLSSADGSYRVGGQFQPGVVRPGDPIAAFQFPSAEAIKPDLILEAEGDNFVALAEATEIGDRPVTEVLEEMLQYVDRHVVATIADHV